MIEMEIKRQRDRDERREQIEEPVDVGRQQIFFGQELEDVGQRLHQAVRTDTQRAGAGLNMRQNFSLDPLQVGKRGHEDGENNGDLDEADDDRR